MLLLAFISRIVLDFGPRGSLDRAFISHDFLLLSSGVKQKHQITEHTFLHIHLYENLKYCGAEPTNFPIIFSVRNTIGLQHR
jgi:hypothetical protein